MNETIKELKENAGTIIAGTIVCLFILACLTVGYIEQFTNILIK